MPELSVVLPCYNESGNLPELLRRYRDVAHRVDMELILVDNGSTDQTSSALEEALKSPENGFLRTVRLDVNLGYGHGLKSGLREARAPIVAISHADLQCEPSDLETAINLYRQHAKSGLCLVKGRRSGARPWADRVVTWFYNHLASWLLSLSALESQRSSGLRRRGIVDVNAEPKCFPRIFLDEVLRGPADFTFDLHVLVCASRRGAALIEFPVEYKARFWGRSKLAANPWMRVKTAGRAFQYMLRTAS